MFYSQPVCCTAPHPKPYSNKQRSLSIAKGLLANVPFDISKLQLTLVYVKETTSHRGDGICFDLGPIGKPSEHVTYRTSGELAFQRSHLWREQSTVGSLHLGQEATIWCGAEEKGGESGNTRASETQPRLSNPGIFTLSGENLILPERPCSVRTGPNAMTP